MAGPESIGRRRALRSATVGVAVGLVGCLGRNGTGSPSTTVTDDFTFESSAFDDGGEIPTQYTCDGIDVSPPLTLDGLPGEAESVAIVVDDPDAPGSGAFTHWLIWNVPADVGTIEDDVPKTRTVERLGGARQGHTDFGNDDIGYSGPCPPQGDGPHTYRFRAYATRNPLSVSAGVGKSTLTDALSDVDTWTSQFTGEYERG